MNYTLRNLFLITTAIVFLLVWRLNVHQQFQNDIAELKYSGARVTLADQDANWPLTMLNDPYSNVNKIEIATQSINDRILAIVRRCKCLEELQIVTRLVENQKKNATSYDRSFRTQA